MRGHIPHRFLRRCLTYEIASRPAPFFPAPPHVLWSCARPHRHPGDGGKERTSRPSVPAFPLCFNVCPAPIPCSVNTIIDRHSSLDHGVSCKIFLCLVCTKMNFSALAQKPRNKPIVSNTRTFSRKPANSKPKFRMSPAKSSLSPDHTSEKSHKKGPQESLP